MKTRREVTRSLAHKAEPSKTKTSEDLMMRKLECLLEYHFSKRRIFYMFAVTQEIMEEIGIRPILDRARHQAPAFVADALMDNPHIKGPHGPLP